MKKILLCVLLFSNAFCTLVGENGTQLVYQEEIIKREDAISELKTGIILNTQTCPENKAAGYFSMDAQLRQEIIEPFYKMNGVMTCQISLALVPCGLKPDQNKQLFYNLYRMVLKNCPLKKAGN